MWCMWECLFPWCKKLLAKSSCSWPCDEEKLCSWFSMFAVSSLSIQSNQMNMIEYDWIECWELTSNAMQKAWMSVDVRFFFCKALPFGRLFKVCQGKFLLSGKLWNVDWPRCWPLNTMTRGYFQANKKTVARFVLQDAKQTQSKTSMQKQRSKRFQLKHIQFWYTSDGEIGGRTYRPPFSMPAVSADKGSSGHSRQISNVIFYACDCLCSILAHLSSCCPNIISKNFLPALFHQTWLYHKPS